MSVSIAYYAKSLEKKPPFFISFDVTFITTFLKFNIDGSSEIAFVPINSLVSTFGQSSKLLLYAAYCCCNKSSFPSV